MKENGTPPKGTFGKPRLPLAKRYLLPSRRVRPLLFGLVPALALLAFAIFNTRFQQAGFLSNGPLSSSHAGLESECSSCHTRFSGLSLDKCDVCHEKVGDPVGVFSFAAHSLYRSGDFGRVEGAAEGPDCNLCHVEHEGREARMTNVTDARCLSCHEIGSFNQKHPQFAFSATGEEDDARLNFTHIFHVRKVMKRGALLDVEKACLSCHNPREGGKSFQPIAFEDHCADCHLPVTGKSKNLRIKRGDAPEELGVETPRALIAGVGGPLADFNPREFSFSRGDRYIVKSPVDHRDPWILQNLRLLRAMLYRDTGLADLLKTSAHVPANEAPRLYEEAIETLEQYARELRGYKDSAIREDLKRVDEALTLVKSRLRDPYAALDETKFLLNLQARNEDLTPAMAEEIGILIQDLTEPCVTCHILEEATLLRAQEDQRALRRAEFNHRAHVLQRRCLDCHYRIPVQDYLGNSEPVAEDVDHSSIQNLPPIETCRECHRPELTSNRCVTCHQYHPEKDRHADLLLYQD